MTTAPEYYVYTGSKRRKIPDHVTHVLIAKALKFVRKRAFAGHPNIQEVICHDGVLKIEQEAFNYCPQLRRVIMPGVKEVDQDAFNNCTALASIECGKLETIEGWAFLGCQSLSSIDLPSIKIVLAWAFARCKNLTNVKLGKELETIGTGVFYYCRSLERITLPLKDGVISATNTFQYCERLSHVDLVGGVHENVAALLLEEWENRMNEEIVSINQILTRTSSGNDMKRGGKAKAIRKWITSASQNYSLQS